MVSNHQQHDQLEQQPDQSKRPNTNTALPPKPGWRMLSSTELETVSALNRNNGNTPVSKHISGTQNAYASSSKSVLPMHSLIDSAPSPLPLVYRSDSTTSNQTPEYVPTGSVVPRALEGKPDQIPGSSSAGSLTVAQDGRTLCVRHQMMADQDVNGKLQKSLDALPVQERAAITALWSTFSSSPHFKRKIILEGILTMCCFSQLSHLSEALSQIIRVDPFTLFPREVCLRVLGYLDAISLGKAAQVSKLWKGLADDDLLWRRMCGQHIERKCTKCGWGLPLLERRRLRKELNNGAPDRMMVGFEHDDHDHAHAEDHQDQFSGLAEAIPTSGIKGHRMVSLPRSFTAQIPQQAGSSAAGPSSATAPGGQSLVDQLMQAESSAGPSSLKRSAGDEPPRMKRRRMDSSSRLRQRTSDVSSDSDVSPAVEDQDKQSNSMELQGKSTKKPWKHVYCERLIVERNWRKGRYTERTLKGHTNGIMCLQFHQNLSTPSYPVLITGSYDRTVRVWDLDKGEVVRVLHGHTRAVRALQFDQVMLVTGSMDRTLKIWNWRTGHCVRTLEGHTDGVVCLNYNKETLASGSADAVIKIWNIATGDCYALRGHQGWVNSVLLWDGKSSPSEQSVQDTSLSISAQPSQAESKSFLFSASDDGTIKLWDLHQRACIKTFIGHTGHVQSLKLFIIEKDQPESDDETSSHRNATSSYSAPYTSVEGGPSSCYSPSVSTFGSRSSLVTGATMQHDYGNALATPHHSMQQSGTSVFQLDDDKEAILVSGGLDNMVKIWDADTGMEKRTLFGHIEGVWGVDIDTLRLASGSHDRTIKIWDRESGRCAQTLVGHRGAVTSIQLSDDLLISGSDDGEIRVWNFGPQTTAATAATPVMPAAVSTGQTSIMRSTN